MSQFNPAFFYHFVERENLPSVRRHGLLSTERLLQITGMEKNDREKFLTTHRPGSVTLKNGVVIRGQEPMPPGLLEPALRDGMTSAGWYRLLNRFVFLWANSERVERHARAFSGKFPLIFVFDAQRILRELGDKIFVSPINSGNARRAAVPRSANLFVPYHAWRDKGWSEIDGKKRPASSLPVEITIENHLPLEPYLLKIEEKLPINAARLK